MSNLFLKIFLIFLFPLFGQWDLEQSSQHKERNKSVKKYFPIPNLELPQSSEKKEIVTHTAYTLSYNENHEQADWVAYLLTKAHTIPVVDRGNNFLPDPLVASGTADDDDYLKSGFDRGHLAPAADMKWSEQVMKESFYYSNMSPQIPSFNRGIWSALEEQVRNWAKEYDSLYIVTGPVLKNKNKVIGPHKVTVPEYYYKVVLQYSSSGQKGIGFLLPNAASSMPLKNFVVSIDSIEKISGIDFFWRLPNKAEKSLEKKSVLQDWTW